jgi:hypothetical protein
LAEYEGAMLPRSASAAADAGGLFEMLASENAAQKLIAVLTGTPE